MPNAALPTPATAPAPAARPTEPLRALTAVRGLAAWWVVGFHFREALPNMPRWAMGVLASGYLAVDLFFILSGYVIALNYSAWFTPVPRNAARYRRFLALRLSRIYPLHLVLLLAFLINPLAVAMFSHHGALADLRWGYFGLSLLLMQEWGFSPGLGWNVPAWSISAEWLAYLLFPILAVAQSAAGGTRLRAWGCAGLLLLGLGGIAAVFSPTGLGYDAPWFGLTRCLSEFSVGICLAALGRDGRGPRMRRIALGLAAGCLLAYAVFDVPDFAVAPLGFAAMIYALMDERSALARALRWPPLQWLGVVSYSTYLSHYLLKTWIKFALVRPGIPGWLAFSAYLALVLLASGVLHYTVERPGQRILRGLMVRSPRAGSG